MTDENDELTLEERVVELENRVEYLASFHPQNPENYFDLNCTRVIEVEVGDSKTQRVEIGVDPDVAQKFIQKEPSKIAINDILSSVNSAVWKGDQMEVGYREVAEFYADVFSESFDVEVVELD